MHLNGKTEVYGLIGNPVEHSISPLIHNTLAEKLEQNMVYETFLVKPEELKQAITGAHALGIKGLNVTVPYKTDIMQYVKSIDDEAKIIGAVNTLVYQEDGYHAKNTDFEGLHQAMIHDGIDLNAQDIIILGAGGAARAVIVMCLKYSSRNIYLVNRTFETAQSLAELNNQFFHTDRVIPMSMDLIDEIPFSDRKYLAIQTTSVGLYPNIDKCPVQQESFFEKVGIGYDIIYNPQETLFMQKVKAHGGIVKNGLGMLLYQGIFAFETWRNQHVDPKLCEEILICMKEEIHEK